MREPYPMWKTVLWIIVISLATLWMIDDRPSSDTRSVLDEDTRDIRP